MRIEFDPAKDAANKRKHGLSLALAEQMNWSKALIELDIRFHYDEIRMNAIVPFGEKFYFASFTERNEKLRIIGLRYAEKHEVNKYVRNYI